MRKDHAIEMLGGTVTSAACAVGVTASAVTQWPDELPQRIADRVQAALWRKAIDIVFQAALGIDVARPELIGAPGAPEVPAKAAA